MMEMAESMEIPQNQQIVHKENILSVKELENIECLLQQPGRLVYKLCNHYKHLFQVLLFKGIWEK